MAKVTKAQPASKEAAKPAPQEKRSARSRSRNATMTAVVPEKPSKASKGKEQASKKKENAGKVRKIKRESVSPEDTEEKPDDSVTYEKGSYLAFVDSSDDIKTFKIVHVTKDVQGHQDITGDVFKVDGKIPTQFVLQAKNQTVFDNTVICDVKVEVTKTVGKKAQLPQELSITKQLNNKVNKLLPTIIEALKENDSQKTESEHDESQSEAESENSDDKIALTQPPEKRRILKVVGIKKAKAPAATQSATKQADKTVSMDVDQSKTRPTRKVAAKKGGKEIKIQEIGKKRRRNGTSEDEEDDEDQEHDEDSEELKGPRKQRKVAAGNTTVIEQIRLQRPKPAPKMPTVYKKGKWNPDIEIVHTCEELEGDGKDIQKGCCTRCNNRNVIRAALTNNLPLLKTLIHDKKNISNLNAYWGPDHMKTAIELMLLNNQLDQVEAMLHPDVKPEKNENYAQARNKLLLQDRAKDGSYLLNIIETGRVSHMAYGSYVRSVQMTRGNRQGNNAFLEYDDNETLEEWFDTYHDQSLRFSKKLLNVNAFKMLMKVLGGTNVDGGDFMQGISSYIQFIIRVGDWKLAEYVVGQLQKHPHYGFNELHHNVLKKLKANEKLPEFKSINITKKATMNLGMTPLHFACINPDTNILKELLSVNGDVNMLDNEMRRPVHYAAACETPDNLKFLIEKGANLADIDNRKVTCLHTAVMAGRAKNVKIICEKQESLVKFKNKSGMTPMAYALENCDLECIKALLETKQVKINQGHGAKRMQPLHYAAAAGNFEVTKWLIDNKATVCSKDKFKRTPLIMAVRNGHVKVASLLLQHGAEWEGADSSGNTPLHHAAAYGWRECIELLLKAGADINAENSWRVTPINIAMLKNHEGIVKLFLDKPEVDVNCKDEKGRTLLTLSLLDLNERTVDFVKYLLSKGADPNIADIDQQTALHYLAKSSNKIVARNHWEMQQTTPEERDLYHKTRVEYQCKLADLLLSHGASLTNIDSQKRTPFTVCLNHDNIDLMEKLIANVSLNKEPSLLHEFVSKILDVRYQRILFKLLENETPTRETMNVLNSTGLSPFLAYIEHFCSVYTLRRGNCLQLIQAQAAIYLADIDKYEIDNRKILEESAQQQANPNQKGGYGRAKVAKKTGWQYNNNNNFGGGFEQHDVIQDALPIEKRNQLADKLMEELVVVPFIACLDNLITKGANAHIQVQKLEKFRLLEEERRKIQLNASEVRRIIPEEEKAQRREEVLKKRAAYKKAQAPLQPGAPKQNKDEPEYHETMGLQNAYHLAVSCPHPKLLDLLAKHEINPDQVDFRHMTPFNLASTKINVYDHSTTTHLDLFTKLISLKVRADYPDAKGRTPFLNYFADNRQDYFIKCLQLGANVNQMDVTGLFALKYALIRRDGKQIDMLVKEWKANINQIDTKGRNLLHHAVNMSSASADATFETEQQLIDYGIEINLRDRHNRTPLHYAFVKIKDWQNKSNIDPIETVSSLCGCRGLEMDVPDKWQKTPLHYAAQRGSSICFIYLNKRGVNKESVDIYGNTPLGVALLNHHHNAAIMMIQKEASVRPLVYKENPEKINKMWKEQEAAARGPSSLVQASGPSDDVNMVAEEENDKKKKKHRQLFDKNDGSDYDDEEDDYDEEDEDEDEDSDDQFEANAFNNQNAFGQTVYKAAAKSVPAQYQYINGVFTQGGAMPAQAAQPAPTQTETIPEEPRTMFRIAINHGQQGLAYSMLDEGYNLMHAMQDAMDEKKFQLCLTLLSKYTDDKIVQQKNNKGQNLFHVLCENSMGCRLEHLKRIYETLKKRGVDCLEVDGLGRSALHYAVGGGQKELVEMLLDQGADPRTIDMHGDTPLTLYLKGPTACKSVRLYNTVLGTYDPIFQLLAKHGADMNTVYTEKSFEPEHKPLKVYKCTLLLNFIRHLAHTDIDEDSSQLRSGLLGLMHFGATLDIVDNNYRDAMTYAISANNLALADFLINNGKKCKLNTKFQDYHKKNAIHYIVNPCEFGSFENVEMLDLLHHAGYDLNLQDDKGMTPIDYAAKQKSGTLAKHLAKLLKQDLQMEASWSYRKASDWPDCSVDYNNDSALFLKAAEEKEEKRLAEDVEKKEKELVPVDQVGGFEKSYKVFCEGKKPWDCYLTKVDLKNGIYGDFVFYKMQLLYDSVRDLYVVFTRWGRIGEAGMNQRTPFPKLEDAQKDFCTIFKSKTGNDFTDLDNFQRVKKKYDIARVNYVTVSHKDYLAPFDFKIAPKSKLERNVQNLIEEIGNVTMYMKAMTGLNIDTEVMPISGIKKDVIQRAMEILKDISNACDEDKELSSKGFNADLEKLTEVRDKISELSSRYYELIPASQYRNQIAPPIKQPHQFKAEYDKLNDLLNIEQASKILLGALYRQSEVNPVDYIHSALNMDIEFLNPDTAEFRAIQTYVKNTDPGNSYTNWNTHKINVFKVERKGEAENYEEFREVGNHRLLFHGTSVFNYVGILAQGMKIAPPEAPATGYMFGKGLYFADMYQKSAAYSRTNSDSTILMLCDVACGKMKRLYQATEVTNLERPFNSVHGVGLKGPDHTKSLVHPDGVQIPIAPVIEYKKDEFQLSQQNNNTQARMGGFGWNPFQGNIGLQHNEFVVYNTSQVRIRYLIQYIAKSKDELARERASKL